MKEKKNAGCLFLAVMLLCAFPAMAAEYYWVPGAADWSSSASYANADGSAAGRVPSANDELAIPENCTVTLDCDNAEHFAIANRLARVRPLTESSYFVVTVSDGKEATFSPKINYDGTTAYAGWYKGGLVKRGLGTLILGSGGGHWDYFTDITVEEGVLKLPQNATGYSWRYYDLIAVSNGATLFTCSTADGTSGKTMTAPLGLIGGGVVTNDCVNECYLEILGSGRNWSHEFAGRLTGSITLNNGRTHFYLTGTNNTFRGIMAMRDEYPKYPLEDVMIGLRKIGMKADAESSAGKYNTTYGLGFQDTCQWNRKHGSGYLYLGDGETTDKDFYVHATDANNNLQGEDPNFFDAGAVGGLTFTGAFRIGDNNNHRFILTGSNTSECVIAGPVMRKKDSNNSSTNYNWRFIKKGVGAWRFADVSNTQMEGVFAVENGSLRYDSIAEKGSLCSLGYSTLLLEDYTGKIDDSRRVDCAFELGSTADVSADPIFEYTGAAKSWCFTRPIGMKGSARLRHSGGGELRLAHLRTLNNSSKTLTLDGDGENAWIYNVCDAHGTLSLVKDGSGTWNVAGTNQISGSVAVKGGTLNLQHHMTPYTWFRWTHKETCGGWKTVFYELGLYSETGIRINSGLTYASTSATDIKSILEMDEGTVVMGTPGGYDSPANVAHLFDNVSTTKWSTAHRKVGTNNAWDKAVLSDPSTWWSIVMRLEDASAPVASYDLLGYGKSPSDKPYVPRAFMLEGSSDGVNWYVVDDYDAGGNIFSGLWLTWRFGDETWKDEVTCLPADIINHNTGRQVSGCADLPAVLADVTEISVAAGARLAVTGGDAIALRSGITLTVDASTGAGTLANMILPESGTLAMVNVPEFGGSLEMSITGENVTGLDNISKWGLSVNGVAQVGTKYRCRYANGKIVMYKPGTVVVFR